MGARETRSPRGIVAVAAIIVYFTALYIIGVRRYAGGR